MHRPELSRAPLSGEEQPFFAVEYEPERAEIVMLDQRRLPGEVVYHRHSSADEVAGAIREGVVGGAPSIAIAAAYALALLAKKEKGEAASFLVANGIAGRILNETRPAAVTLGWVIARMSRRAADSAALDPDARAEAMLHEAEAIHREGVAACRAIGALGAKDVPEGATILTHGSAGALATGGYGTALGVVRAAHAAGKDVRVLVSETRPGLEGARLSSWELAQEGIAVEVITDSMAGHFFQRGAIDFVVVGGDRVAASGDVASAIGSYTHAVLANAHGVPFTVAAPSSAIDRRCPSGEAIPIEEGPRDAVATLGGATLVPDGVACRHPAVDITPARLVSAIYTERGLVRPAQGERLEDLERR